MLRTRVITALILLAVVIAVFLSKSFLFLALVMALFFAAAAWECCRLFNRKHPVICALVSTMTFGLLTLLISRNSFPEVTVFFGVCVAIWVVRLVPLLAIGLPSMEGWANRLLNGIYGTAILGCFMAITVLFMYSPAYLFSIMSIVWIADIGAYFSGKAFGKHKLAPSISPGKSWEGAIGGWLAVLIISSAAISLPVLIGTFPVKLFLKLGWPGLFLISTLLVAASIVGDLFESQLKRRANMKDSSNLLPGHGGVLDRIDALIPTLPLAALVHAWL